MITTDDFIPHCGCRAVGECTHGMFAECEAFDAVVNAFAKKMKAKFRRKFVKGFSGWDNKDEKKYLVESLRQHAQEYDMVDVANLAAMIWNLEQP